jgi:hypothetical protein
MFSSFFPSPQIIDSLCGRLSWGGPASGALSLGGCSSFGVGELGALRGTLVGLGVVLGAGELGELAGLGVVDVAAAGEGGGLVGWLQDLAGIRVGRLGSAVKNNFEKSANLLVQIAVGLSAERVKGPVLARLEQFAESRGEAMLREVSKNISGNNTTVDPWAQLAVFSCCSGGFFGSILLGIGNAKGDQGNQENAPHHFE